MQQPGRLRLRPWLEEQIQSGKYPGVSWLDQTARIFQIPWKHAARHGWSIDRDATLFRNWAMHTGRYRPGKDKPDPKTWKANFRCALNSLSDVCELREHSRKRGSNAYRVYRMLPSSQTHRHKRGLRLFSRTKERQTDLGECKHDDAFTANTWQLTTKAISDIPQKVETTAHMFNSTQTHGMWEYKPEDQQHTDGVLKLMDHFSSTDLWNQTGEQRGWRTHTLWDQWQCTDGSERLHLCTGDENPHLLHTDDYSDISGPNYIKELTDWTTHQQTLMP